ncbi:MAG: hypothetical protein ACT4NX_02115 [Deltaproteobacteria bacterium]
MIRNYILIIAVLIFSISAMPMAALAEKDGIKQQMQELREQMKAMQQRLNELEEKNQMLEDESKAQRVKSEEAIVKSAPQPDGGYIQRVIQSLNPDISAIGLFSAAYFSEDEPFVRAEADPENTGVNLQEIEIGFQASIDPYLRADSFFSIGREGIETEEAYATTLLTLPLNLQIRAGLMRAKFGRINLQHRHDHDFATLPLPAASFLSEHLNPIGVEFNFLLPLPWFAELSASVNSPDGLETPTFARDEDANDLARLLYIFHSSNFFELSEALSLKLGASFATGANGTEPGSRSNLYGGDLFVKYRPLRGSSPYQELSLQSEFIYQQAETTDADLNDWGGYAQVVYRFAKRWNAGARFDFVDTDDPISLLEEEAGIEELGLRVARTEEEEEPSLGLFGKELRYAAMLTFNPSEFSRIRLQYEYSDPDFADSSHALFLQLQYSIGAHGAHKF